MVGQSDHDAPLGGLFVRPWSRGRFGWRGAYFDGPYNIRLHQTAPRERCSTSVRGEPQRLRLHSGFSADNWQRWFIAVVRHGLRGRATPLVSRNRYTDKKTKTSKHMASGLL